VQFPQALLLLFQDLQFTNADLQKSKILIIRKELKRMAETTVMALLTR